MPDTYHKHDPQERGSFLAFVYDSTAASGPNLSSKSCSDMSGL